MMWTITHVAPTSARPAAVPTIGAARCETQKKEFVFTLCCIAPTVAKLKRNSFCLHPVLYRAGRGHASRGLESLQVRLDDTITKSTKMEGVT